MMSAPSLLFMLSLPALWEFGQLDKVDRGIRFSDMRL